MEKKHSTLTKKSTSHIQDGEGIRTLDEQDLEQVAGGYMVAEGVPSSQVAAMEAKGFYVYKSQDTSSGLVMMTPFRDRAVGQ